MSRPYRITDVQRELIVQDFRETLLKNPMTGGTLTYTKTFDCGRATILFTPVAYLKQAVLVRETASEIGWHGVVHRSEKDPRVFIVEDILVYPQKVTGTSINPDQAEYNSWQDGFDDATFEAMRFHGHSHVNMGVFSSSVDDGYQNSLIAQLGPEMFQIFMILNKRGEHWQKIVDLKENIVFDSKDIDIGLTECGFDYAVFLADAKAKLRPDVATPTVIVHPSAQTPMEPQTLQELTSKPGSPVKSWSYQQRSKMPEEAYQYREMYDDGLFTSSGYFGDDGIYRRYEAWPEGMEDYE